MKIGFIGTGVMGTGIVKNLLKAGNRVTVYNRTKAHAEEVLAAGASWAASPAEAANMKRKSPVKVPHTAAKPARTPSRAVALSIARVPAPGTA